MKRILVWPNEFAWEHDHLCGKCERELDHLKAADPFGLVCAEVPSMCFCIPFRGHVFEVMKLAQPWSSWRAYGQPLCGAIPQLGDKGPPYELLWLSRLFHYSGQEEHEALRETLMMLALVGEPFMQNLDCPFPLPAKGERGL